jgi:hypothetical protein
MRTLGPQRGLVVVCKDFITLSGYVAASAIGHRAWGRESIIAPSLDVRSIAVQIRFSRTGTARHHMQ